MASEDGFGKIETSETENQESLYQNAEEVFDFLEGDDEALKNLQIEIKKIGQKNEKNKLRKEIKELKRKWAVARKNGSKLDAATLTEAKKLHDVSRVFCLKIDAWNKLTPKEKKAIEDAKKQKDRKIALATASASEEIVAETTNNSGDIGQVKEKSEDTQQESVTDLPEAGISDKEKDDAGQATEAEAIKPVIENVLEPKAEKDEEPIEEMEEFRKRKEKLDQELGLAEVEFEDAELKYEQKKADNKETFKGLMATLRIKSFGGGQVRVEEELFRKKMEEKKQIVEDLKQKIKDLEPKQEKEMLDPVLDGFEKMGVKKEELEKMDGFEKLPEGQKLLVLENLKQLTLGRIQEEAVENVNKDIAGSNILGKIWKNVGKKYYIAKKEKASAKELMSGGMSVHEETLKQLVAGAKEGPGVEIKDGKLEIQYVSGLNNLTPEQEGQVAEFNTVATEFSKIPYEWSLATASKEENKRYKELELRYQEVADNILYLKLFANNNYTEAVLYVNDLERNVKLNQFLNNNPDVEKQLASIKDETIWQKSLLDIATSKGIIAGAGFVARSATVSLIGLAGVPLTAAGIGGIMAWKRAKGTLRDNELMARKGKEDESLEKKDFVDAAYLQESIGNLMEEIKNPPKEVIRKDSETGIESTNAKQLAGRREEMLRSLEFHLMDAKMKLDNGTVNFGKKDERLSNQFRLVKIISEGAVFLEANRLYYDDKGWEKDSIDNWRFHGLYGADRNKYDLEARVKESIEVAEKNLEKERVKNPKTDTTVDRDAIRRSWEKRIELESKGDYQVILDSLKKQNVEISEARRRYLLEKTLKGVVLGASFASIGMAARHFGEAWFGWNTPGKAVAESQPIEVAKYDLTNPVPATPAVESVQPVGDPAAVVAEDTAKPNTSSVTEVGSAGVVGVSHGVDPNPDNSGPMNALHDSNNHIPSAETTQLDQNPDHSGPLNSLDENIKPDVAPGTVAGGVHIETGEIANSNLNHPGPMVQTPESIKTEISPNVEVENAHVEMETQANQKLYHASLETEPKITEPISAEKLVPGSVEKTLDGVEVKPKIPEDTMTIRGKGKVKGRIPNIEKGLIRKAMAELGISKKEAGTLAHQMTHNYLKSHPGENPNLVHDGDVISKIDFKNKIYNIDRVSNVHDGAHVGGVAVEDARMNAITEQMNQEEISRSYNNQIMGEHAAVPEAKTQAFSSSDGDRLHQGEVKTQAFSVSDGDRFEQAELEKTKMFSSSDGDRLHPNAPESHVGASDGDRFHSTETRSIEHAGASEGDRFTPTEAKNLEHSGASDGDRFQPTQARNLEHSGASDGDRFNPVKPKTSVAESSKMESNLNNAADIRGVELSLLEKANIEKVADIFDDSIFSGNNLARQITETRSLKGMEFYRAYREIYRKIIENTFSENGINSRGAGEYLEKSSNPKIEALIRYNSDHFKDYSVEPTATETMGAWMTRNINKALSSCGIGFDDTRFKT